MPTARDLIRDLSKLPPDTIIFLCESEESLGLGYRCRTHGAHILFEADREDIAGSIVFEEDITPMQIIPVNSPQELIDLIERLSYGGDDEDEDLN